MFDSTKSNTMVATTNEIKVVISPVWKMRVIITFEIGSSTTAIRPDTFR